MAAEQIEVTAEAQQTLPVAGASQDAGTSSMLVQAVVVVEDNKVVVEGEEEAMQQIVAESEAFTAAESEATGTEDSEAAGTGHDHGSEQASDGTHSHSGTVDPADGLNNIILTIEGAELGDDTASVLAAMEQMNTAFITALDRLAVLDDHYVSWSEVTEIGAYLAANYPEWDQWANAIAPALAKTDTKLVGRGLHKLPDYIKAIAGSPYGHEAVDGKPISGQLTMNQVESASVTNRVLFRHLPHHYMAHVLTLLGPDALAPGQQATGGFVKIDDTTYEARSPISGLRPVIEQAIDQVKRRNPNAEGQQLESLVAKRLTGINDWAQLEKKTKEAVMLLAGLDFPAMSKTERELTINHLLHSPMPFGNLDQVLTPDVTVDFGFTHTLDKKWTRVTKLDDGQFRIFMISNNANGSHTGHSLGSFILQGTEEMSKDEAKKLANAMVKNKNNNNKLYLDDAAKAILYGETPRLDFSGMTDAEKKAVYEGNVL